CSSSYVLLRISRGHPHLYAFPTRRSSDLVQIVGGLEHMQHIPMDAGIDLNPKLFHRTSKGALAMGVTAEFLAQTQGISREEQDKFALRSHQLAAATQAKGEFRREMLPVWGRDEAGNRVLVDHDQCVRPDATL